MIDSDFAYEGSELEIFKHATCWKNYFSTFIVGHLGRSVLEVGAGMGSSTSYLLSESVDNWLCLEPDALLASKIQHQIESNPAFRKVTCCQKFLSEIDTSLMFDTILYLDVLEHIEDDNNEVSLAVKHLKIGGQLIVLAPAHPHLYSEFDKAIGHHRRYALKDLCCLLGRNGLNVRRSIYIDSIGYFLSLGNSVFTRQSAPSKGQILFWDKVVIPLSRIIDPLLMHKWGKSTLVIAQKDKLLK